MKLTFSRFVVVTALVGLIALGFGIGIRELIHLKDKVHPFSWLPFAVASVFILIPALILDTTGKVKGALEFVGESIPGGKFFIRSGQRSTDPVIPAVAKTAIVVEPAPVTPKEETKGTG